MLGASRVLLFSAGVLSLLSLQSVQAYCPNGCNAQGLCGKNDKCTCFLRKDEDSDISAQNPAFKGADCSLRTCPTGVAWVSTAVAANNAHPRTECSSAGFCDYVTGQCDCLPGYEGKACERTVCPNNCNNRGICLSLKNIIANAPATPTGALDGSNNPITTAILAYSGAWDGVKHMGCVCDQGYRGPDCSLKECPSGPDVLLAYGATEGRDCGGRGKCNYETGTCECFPGYYGTACESQTTVH